MEVDDLFERTYQFALRVIRLVRALPKTCEGNAVANQLVRAGTSVGANYRAARRGRSRREFLAKLGVTHEECDESAYWLRLIIDTKMLPDEQVKPLYDESIELTKIFSKSRKTGRENDPDG